jgi:hypothetical protein
LSAADGNAVSVLDAKRAYHRQRPKKAQKRSAHENGLDLEKHHGICHESAEDVQDQQNAMHSPRAPAPC